MVVKGGLEDLACKEDTHFDLVCRKGVKKVERFRSLNFFAQVQVDISLIFVYMDNFLPVSGLLYPCRSFLTLLGLIFQVGLALDQRVVSLLDPYVRVNPK